tara:strand:- start:314 stop:1366 length:1053 start_codon:yes stop_codon:yes gene_type:complete
LGTVLTTGGLGFVGSHTCIELLNAGYNVLIIDSLSNSLIETLYNIKKILSLDDDKKKGDIYFREGDLRDKKWLDNIFNEFKIKGNEIYSVIHLAGLKAVEESVEDPLKYWDCNLNITLNLLWVMQKYGCYKLVFSSSATIYGIEGGEKIKENFVKRPINPYGNTKLTIEKILSDLYKSNPNLWGIAILRYFNPAGSHKSGLIGEDPRCAPTNLFPLIVKTGLKERSHLFIFGKDWPTSDGTCIRDFIHVTDLAKAHLASLEFLSTNKPNIRKFNIGTGKGYSVLEVVKTFMKVNNLDIPYTFKERRKGDNYYAVANNLLALSCLKWKPEKNLEDICRDSWNFVTKKNSKF